MLQEVLNFKAEFYAQLEKYNIPTHNRAVCFYFLALAVERHPDNATLRQLLITAICDSELLLCHFLPKQSTEEIIENYRTTCLRKNTFNKLWNENEKLANQWIQLTKRKTLPNIDSFISPNQNNIQNEINMLCLLYHQYFEISEKKTPELKNNLEHFVILSHSHSNYHLIAPFFFYQIMIKHTKRLASNSNFQFSPKGLWQYKQYIITRNNDKNYETYKKNILLFLDLCKYYELFEDVDIDLSKYGFSHTSNLIEWTELYDEDLAEGCKTPLSLFYESLDLSHIEPYEADTYDAFSTYNVSFETDCYYHDIYTNEYIKAETAVTNFILKHIEYLITYMQEIHHNIKAIKNIVQTIYDNTNLDYLYPDEIPMEYRLFNIHFTLSDCLDKAVKAKIQTVL